MLSRLFKKNNPTTVIPTDGLTQQDREAIIDLLHYAMYSDQRLSDAEDKFVDSYVDSLAWESGVSPDLYVNQSISNVRSFPCTNEGRAEFIKDIAGKLSSPFAKAKALTLLGALIRTDGTSDQEALLLSNAKKVFE